MIAKQKTALFAALVATTIISFSIMTYAQTMPGDEDSVSDPVRANENTTRVNENTTRVNENTTRVNENTTRVNDDVQARIDAMGFAIVQLHLQNGELVKYSTNEYIQDMIDDNNEDVADLVADMEDLLPELPTVEIPEEEERSMHTAMHKLAVSGLPILGMEINTSTGTLDVEIDINKTTTDTEDNIRNITSDIRLNIYYGKDDAVFQSSCDPTTRYCNPLIGGSLGEDEYWGKDCTVSIAAVRNTGSGTENGIVIPTHCNPNTTQYYQADNDEETHLVGIETKDGGWFCDCDFVKSNSREIHTSKIVIGLADLTLLGKSDLSKGDMVFMHGATSGLDHGRIIEVNVWKRFGGTLYSDLYKIEGIDYTDGDSGASIIGSVNGKYGGMNIGADGGYNYGHDWTFLKSKLNLR